MILLDSEELGRGHVLSGMGVSNVRIAGLTVDGNNLNATPMDTHGIRFSPVVNGNGDITTAVEEVTIENVEVKNTGYYGIGFAYGGFRGIRIRDVRISHTPAGGIDFKNISNMNRDIVMSGIRVDSPGLATRIGLGQAGIDIRGIATLSDIHVEGLRSGASVHGIRFRDGQTSSTHGEGAQGSSLTNFAILANAAPNGGDDSYGIYVQSRNVAISNGYIQGVDQGMVIAHLTADGGPADTLVSNVTVKEAVLSGFGVVNSDGVRFVNCVSLDNKWGFRLSGGSDNSILSSTIRGGDRSVRILAPNGMPPTARTTVSHTLFDGAAMTALENNGTETKLIANIGLPAVSLTTLIGNGGSSFGSNWGTPGPGLQVPQFRIDGDGVVELFGAAVSTCPPGNGDIILSLPPSLIPGVYIVYTGIAKILSDGTNSRIIMQPDGKLRWFGGGPPGFTIISLNGIRFLPN